MIKKFIKIWGTGKFLNYTHSSVPPQHRTTDFEKINLVYGENGSGKTTLSIILKSLKDNSSLLTKKRSFNRAIPQALEVLTDVAPNPKFTYANNVWDNNYPNLEVFDIHFINENIYTGLETQNSHKKNLFEIIFGQQGIQLKSDIQILKDRIQNENNTLRETKARIESTIDNAYTAADFCNLLPDQNIDGRIIAKEAEILTAKSYQEIQAKSLLASIPTIPPPFDFSTAVSALLQSIDNISEEYIEKFKTHKEHLSMDGKEEEWIKQGYEAISNDTCPFCLRPLDETTDIIEAYKQYFNREYNFLLETLRQIHAAIELYNVEANILLVETKISTNITLIEFWNRHLNDSPTLQSVTDKQDEIQTAFSAVKQLFQEKSSDPIQPQPIVFLETFKGLIDNLNNRLTELNTKINAYNERISTLKSTSQPNLNQLELDLKKLKALKKKVLPNIIALCTELSTSSRVVETLNTQKNEKQEQLNTYSDTIFGSYTTKINQYLQSFAPYLEIKDIDSVYVSSSKEPMIKYALHIDGTEIKFDDGPLHPCFKYSLSEGDKSALALSFFLTKLELAGNLQDKIIVFDDPVSSFDLNRKATTINKLITLGQQAKQLFVFSHNIIFACDFWKSANQVPVLCQCSKIEFVGNTSCIVEFNIDTETLSSILKDSSMIKNFLDNGCYSEQERRNVARCLRPALESYFHLKFFDLVSPTDWLGDFISMVRTATSSDRFFRLQTSLNEMIDINDYSKKYHHKFNSNNDSEPITDAELRNYCDRTLKLIQVM